MDEILKERIEVTMTVAELKEFLGKYPDEMPVVAAWEGQITAFRPENIKATKLDEAVLLVCDVER